MLEILSAGSDIIVLSSTLHLIKLFYLLVLSFRIAENEMIGNYNHIIEKGHSFGEVIYYEIKSDDVRQPAIIYKRLPQSVYVHPAQVMSQKVNVSFVGSDIYLSRDE